MKLVNNQISPSARVYRREINHYYTGRKVTDLGHIGLIKHDYVMPHFLMKPNYQHVYVDWLE